MNHPEKAVELFFQNETEECRALLEKYIETVGNDLTELPDNFEENSTLWYEMLIDTKLYDSYADSTTRKLFVKAAEIKFSEAPDDMRIKFMEGLDTYFPAKKA
ncbi:MAG: hypothetical protein GY714_29995 [Desulfobacterales bacterium]|nr:hypothetical protein [Desulfobacterales bacterium]MCP4164254.1 hypothetical protein [Deltaproteobacteria bacterium]